MTTKITMTKEMTMGEILAVYPGAQRALFQRFHVGGCQSCGFSEDDTLETVCKNHELSVDTVISTLHESHDLDSKIQISAREVHERIQRGEKIRLVDVRESWEYELAHLEGAVLVTDESVVNEVLNWPKDSTIMIYDHQGKRSLDAAAYLIGHGFTHVRSISGGIDAWSREVDPKVPTYV